MGSQRIGDGNSPPRAATARDASAELAAPRSTSPKAPDAELEGRPVRVRLLDGKVVGGRLERVSTYVLVLRLADGRPVRIYKHAAAYLAEA